MQTNRRTPRQFAVGFLSVLACLVACPTHSHAGDSDDERFLTGLIQRQLYALAAAHCQEQLAASKNAADQATWTMGWMRVHTQHAKQLPATQRGTHWAEISRLATDYSSQHVRSSQRLLVDYQAALALMARAELSVLEAAAAAVSAPPEDEVRQHLRDVIRALRDVHEQIDEQLRIKETNTSPLGIQRLSSRKLRGLTASVEHTTGQAYRLQAQRYPAGSPDRVTACQSALVALKKLAPADLSSDAWWESRLDELACLRLQQNWPAAARAVKSLHTVELPTKFQLDLRAEEIHLALEQANFDRALSMVTLGRQIHGESSAQLDLAHLQTYLAHWQDARKLGDATAAASWQKKATASLRGIEQQHSPYWVRRAEALLSGFDLATSSGADADLLSLKARSAYLRGQTAAAILAYDLAAQDALERGDRKRAFDLQFKAAAIAHQKNEHANAVKRFSELSVTFPQNDRASRAQWMAVMNQAQLVRRDVRELPTYERLLATYVTQWPGGEHVDQARDWLARLYENEREWLRAAEQLARISVHSPKQAESLARAGELYHRHFAGNEPDTETITRAIELLRSHYASSSNRWTDGQLQAVLAAARLRLRWSPSELEPVASELHEALLSPAGISHQSWRGAAVATRLSLAAARQNWQQAEALAGEVNALAIDDRLRLVQELSELPTQRNRRARLTKARLQLRILDHVSNPSATLNQQQKRQLERLRGKALLLSEQTDQALVSYRQLAQEHPDDGEIQEQYALLLTNSSQHDRLEQALRQWRYVIMKTPPRSQPWFRAKLSLAQTHYKLHDPQRAAQVIELLAALHPELGGPQLRKQFTDLLARCRPE